MSKNIRKMHTEAAQPTTNDALQHLFDAHFAVELATSAQLRDEVMALRYQVYCREHAFEDATAFPDGRERDDYDPRSVHALVRHRSSGACVAAVRLVLADPQAPEMAFPVEAHCGHALPQAGLAMLDDTPRQRIAEISRLAVSHEVQQRLVQHSDSSVPDAPMNEQKALACVIVGLFAAIVQWSDKLAISHWLAVMEPACLRLLRRYGIRFCHTGASVEYHGRRRPTIARARKLITRIHDARPDVWQLITDTGRVLPAAVPCRLHVWKTPLSTAMLRPDFQPSWPFSPGNSEPTATPALA